jgi:hypothetical protein
MKKVLTVLFAFFAIVAFAADITGNWKGTADFGNGPIERSFSFKVDGKKLTGETSSEMMGKSVITDGVIDGDNISFSITGNLQGNVMTIQYKGKVHNDEITLNAEVAGQTIEWKLTKVS